MLLCVMGLSLRHRHLGPGLGEGLPGVWLPRVWLHGVRGGVAALRLAVWGLPTWGLESGHQALAAGVWLPRVAAC